MSSLVLCLLIGSGPTTDAKEAQRAIDVYLDVCRNKLNVEIDKHKEVAARQEKVLRRLRGATVGNPRRAGRFVNISEAIAKDDLSGPQYFRTNTNKREDIAAYEKHVAATQNWLKTYGPGKKIIHSKLGIRRNEVRKWDIGVLPTTMGFDYQDEQFAIFILGGPVTRTILTQAKRDYRPEVTYALQNKTHQFLADQNFANHLCVIELISAPEAEEAAIAYINELDEESVRYIEEEFAKRVP